MSGSDVLPRDVDPDGADSGSGSTPAEVAREILREHQPVVLGAGLSAVGLLTVALGWYGAAHTTIVQYQIPYLISGGMLGAALLVLGGVVVLAGVTERRHREVLDALEQLAGAGPVVMREQASKTERLAVSGGETDALPAPGFADARSVLWVSGGASYHTGDCQMVLGKQATELTVPRATRRGLVPCRVCRPAASAANGRSTPRTRL